MWEEPGQDPEADDAGGTDAWGVEIDDVGGLDGYGEAAADRGARVSANRWGQAWRTGDNRALAVPGSGLSAAAGGGAVREAGGGAAARAGGQAGRQAGRQRMAGPISGGTLACIKTVIGRSSTSATRCPGCGRCSSATAGRARCPRGGRPSGTRARWRCSKRRSGRGRKDRCGSGWLGLLRGRVRTHDGPAAGADLGATRTRPGGAGAGQQGRPGLDGRSSVLPDRHRPRLIYRLHVYRRRAGEEASLTWRDYRDLLSTANGSRSGPGCRSSRCRLAGGAGASCTG